MTQKEMFEKIATLHADDEEIVTFCKIKIEQLANRSTHKTPTKTQKENVGIMEIIADALAVAGEPVTVTALIEGCDELASYPNQKITALLTKMKNEGRVVQKKEGRKSVYALADTELNA